jgi:hypothetical protein
MSYERFLCTSVDTYVWYLQVMRSDSTHMRVSTASLSALPRGLRATPVAHSLAELGEQWLSLFVMRDFKPCDEDEALSKGKDTL